MGVKVLLPTALRQYANGQDTIEFTGAKVGEVMDQLIATYPELKGHLLDDDGNIRNFVNVYLNEDNLRGDDLVNAPCKDGDEIMLVPAVAGGAVLDAPSADKSPYLNVATESACSTTSPRDTAITSSTLSMTSTSSKVTSAQLTPAAEPSRA